MSCQSPAYRPSTNRRQTTAAGLDSLDKPTDVALEITPPAGEATASNEVWTWVTPDGVEYVERSPDGTVSPVRQPGEKWEELSSAEFLARLFTPLFCGHIDVVPRNSVPASHNVATRPDP
jgi:hypothetical protein